MCVFKSWFCCIWRSDVCVLIFWNGIAAEKQLRWLIFCWFFLTLFLMLTSIHVSFHSICCFHRTHTRVRSSWTLQLFTVCKQIGTMNSEWRHQRQKSKREKKSALGDQILTRALHIFDGKLNKYLMKEMVFRLLSHNEKIAIHLFISWHLIYAARKWCTLVIDVQLKRKTVFFRRNCRAKELFISLGTCAERVGSMTDVIEPKR